jgi:allantoate deiminase/N-carbamoyl-L-amino-acid hydrolase
MGVSALAEMGARILDMADRLAEWSETDDGLTCTYFSPAHRAAAVQLREWMQGAGLAASIDIVGNVVGRLLAADAGARTLIVGSHYDTVRNGGKYDGRLGILTAIVVAEQLRKRGQRLPFHLEVIAFSEEEGVRFARPYIGSSAVAGRFDPSLLEQRDEGGAFLADVLRQSGVDPAAIPGLARPRESLLGYLEVHIEQGPVLLHENLPVGIVSSIAGAVRHRIEIVGAAGHAGTVPMALRHDAAAAAAEVILFIERRCSGVPGLAGTVGIVNVPDGAINVIPGRCDISTDIRGSEDQTRDAAVADILAEVTRIAERRGVMARIREVFRAPAVACSPGVQEIFSAAVKRAGLIPHHMPSGAGHDDGIFDGVCPIGMLFVRCGNGGVSHSPLELVSAEDADIGARILLDAVLNFKP